MPLNPTPANRDRYDVGQACRNSHAVNGYEGTMPQFGAAFCPKCGARTLTACPGCDAPIRGMYLDVLTTEEWSPAPFCTGCGAPFPWTTAGIAAGRELVAMLEGLSDDERSALSASFDDLVRDTPRTGVAAMRVKMALGKVGATGAAALRDVLVGIATESAKKAMGL